MSGPDEFRRYYSRHLPHQVPEGCPIFLTWNLKGALPQHLVDALRTEQSRLRNEPTRKGESEEDRRIRHAKILFARQDRVLHTASDGPMHLRDPRAARIMVESILWGVPLRYELFSYCVMANHVHVLLMPIVELEVITQGIKGYTANTINKLQRTRGRTFWQDESFDHWARDHAELLRIIRYIENNPVAAGLCRCPADWRWSSAHMRAALAWAPGEPLDPEWKTVILESLSAP